MQAVPAPGSSRPPAPAAARSSRPPAVTPPASRLRGLPPPRRPGATAHAGPAAGPRRSRCAAATAAPDICVNCYRLPDSRLQRLRRQPPVQLRRHRPAGLPVVLAAGHRRLRPLRPGPPAAARWPEGPVCDPCYTAALRHRGPCARCGQQRRLVAPPGPDADTCADCAGLPVISACTRLRHRGQALRERHAAPGAACARRARPAAVGRDRDRPRALAACSRRSPARSPDSR